MAVTATTNAPPTTTTTTVADDDDAAAAAAASVSPGIAKTTSSPWTDIVRGPEPEPDPVLVVSKENVENSPESCGDDNAVVSKKPVWDKVLLNNTTLMNGGSFSVVMGDELWPSLSECAKGSSKINLSSDSSKNLPYFGSTLSPQVTGSSMPSSTTIISSVQSHSTTSQKLTARTSNHHSTSNHGQPARQESLKRDGGVDSKANGVSSHQCSQSAGEGAHHLNHGSPKPNSSGSENFGRDNVQNHSRRELSLQRNLSRRGSGGPHSRGEGSHQNHGGRRNDQEHGNHDWNNRRSFNGRDASMQPGGVPRGFVRPPPIFTPFAHHPPVRPAINPMMPPDVPFLYLFPGMPFIAPLPFIPTLDFGLYPEIMKQINYYFSNENLVKDTYLRQKMDRNGWVHVNVISNFNMVKQLTNDTYQILEAVRPSTVVEVQGNKIRRRHDWRRWILPPTIQLPTSSCSQSQSPRAPIAVTDPTQSISLDEEINDPTIVKGQVDDSASSLQASSVNSNSAPQTSVDETSHNGC